MTTDKDDCSKEERSSLLSLNGDEKSSMFSSAQLVVNTEDEKAENIGLENRESKNEEEEDEEDDNGSTHSGSTESLFTGSLHIDIEITPWDSDIARPVDIQLGEEEWGTRLQPIEGGMRPETWETNIANIAKRSEGDALGVEEWNTRIRDFSEDLDLHEDWSSTIAEQLSNLQLHQGWATTLNAMQRVEEEKNRWTSKLKKIREDGGDTKDKWSSKFSKISTKDAEKDDWQFNLTRKMRNEGTGGDWSSRFNSIEEDKEEGEERKWTSRFAEILLRSADRDTHWQTKFQNIAQHDDELDAWPTTFNEISPPGEDEEQQWSSKFLKISEDEDLREGWDTKFLDIDKTVAEDDTWEVNMQDVPDNPRQPADWSTAFNGIHDSEDNVLWDTSFNAIGDTTAEERNAWECKFMMADLEDMGRESWETNDNQILADAEGRELEWEMQINNVTTGEDGGDWIEDGGDGEIESYLNQKDQISSNTVRRNNPGYNP